MEPNATPPWRVLDAPTAGDPASAQAVAPRTSAGSPADVEALTISPQAAKIAAILLGAILAAIGAFLLATSGGDGAVRIDGGEALPLGAASGDPLALPSDGPTGEVVVEVVGAVIHPGVYRLPAGSRVGELVTAAGGYGPRIDIVRTERTLNLAATVNDGDQVRVPSRDDPPEAEIRPGPGTSTGSGSGTGSSPSGGLIDLNHATQAELESLPGIGPVTAQKIMTAREDAPFGAVDELRSRGVLGEKTFEKVRDLVVVG